jgi:uncharacterized membrane protein
MFWFLLYITVGMCVVTYDVRKATRKVIKEKQYNDNQIVGAFFSMLLFICVLSFVWPIVLLLNVMKWFDNHAK